MEHFANNRYLLRSNTTGIFPYRPIPVQAIPGEINGNFFPPIIFRPGDYQGPLDLSLRGPVPITPPSTPSPPRKRPKSSQDDKQSRNYEINQRKFQNFFDQNHGTSLIQNLSNPFLIPEHSDVKFCDINESSNDEQNKTSESVDISVTDDDDQDDFVDITGQDGESQEPQVTAFPNSETTAALNESKKNIDDVIEEPEISGVLENGKRYFEDIALHSQAIQGFAKLFEKNFEIKENENSKVIDVETPIDVEEKSKDDIFQFPKQAKFERKKSKIRKQLIDEDNSSPVSGTIIRKLRDDEELVVRKGDIDPAFNVVEITEEAKATLAQIDNKIGLYICQLCRAEYEDAFRLAQHRCHRIVHIEYKCSECDKVFNCPANLASHKRWHKPRTSSSTTITSSTVTSKKTITTIATATKKKDINDLEEISNEENQFVEQEGQFQCPDCGKMFRRNAYLRKHMTSHQIKTQTTINAIEANTNFETTTPTFEHQQRTVPYDGRYNTVSAYSDYDKKRFHAISELYFQQRERMSAYQYMRDHTFEAYPKRNTFEEMQTTFPYPSK